jgi:hypothetical protein
MDTNTAAAATAFIIATHLGFTVTDEQGQPSRSQLGVRKLVRDLFEQAEREGCLDNVVASFSRHVTMDPAARVRETGKMLLAGYGDMLALFNR